MTALSLLVLLFSGCTEKPQITPGKATPEIKEVLPQTPPSTPTPTLAPLPEWLTYKNKEKKFSFSYPPFVYDVDNDKCPKMPTQVITKGDAFFVTTKYQPGSDCSKNPKKFEEKDLNEPFSPGVLYWMYMPKINSEKEAEAYVQKLSKRKDCKISETSDFSAETGELSQKLFFKLPENVYFEQAISSGCGYRTEIFYPQRKLLVITRGKSNGTSAVGCGSKDCSNPSDADWESKIMNSFHFEK